MNRFRNYVLMAAGFAVLAMVVGVFSAGPAIAQAVRAALVSNVDDPGRIPFRSDLFCDFTGNQCFASSSPVPAGKRLVITHVSGVLRENLPGGTLILTRFDSITDINLPVTFQGSYNGLNYFVFDQSTLVSFDAGQAPGLNVFMGAVPDQNNSGVTFAFMGYMLDCSTGPCAPIAH
jgi:hypothetical protein